MRLDVLIALSIASTLALGGTVLAATGAVSRPGRSSRAARRLWAAHHQ